MKLTKTGRTKLEVEEHTPVQRDVDIFNDFGRQVVALYLKNAGGDPRLEAQLKEALMLREKIDQVEGKLNAAEEQKNAFSQRQAEVRENLKALGKSSANADLKRKLEGTLAELETGLNEVTRRMVQLSMDRSDAKERLAVLVKGIDFEPKTK
jgi:chromosome segregation ATPase